MASLHTVAVLGKSTLYISSVKYIPMTITYIQPLLPLPKGNQEYWRLGVGIQVFDLNVDQICSLLEKPDINKGNAC